jgi:hypothetical protein
LRRGHIRGEWDELKEHDVLFLMTIRPPQQHELAALRTGGREPSPAERYGLLCVRGCEVIEVRDEAGKLMNDFSGGCSCSCCTGCCCTGCWCTGCAYCQAPRVHSWKQAPA